MSALGASSNVSERAYEAQRIALRPWKACGAFLHR